MVYLNMAKAKWETEFLVYLWRFVIGKCGYKERVGREFVVYYQQWWHCLLSCIAVLRTIRVSRGTACVCACVCLVGGVRGVVFIHASMCFSYIHKYWWCGTGTRSTTPTRMMWGIRTRHCGSACVHAPNLQHVHACFWHRRMYIFT